jgi:hypothetical protein
MSEVSSKTVLIRDTGYFASLAERLSRDFQKVLYHNPAWKVDTPKSQPSQMAHEIAPNIEIALDFWEAVKDADIVVFPDICDGDMQEHLRGMDIPVFGSGKGELLELDRWATKELLEELGLNVASSELLESVDELGEYLEKHKDIWVKRPRWRGDIETWHHIDMFMSQQWFDRLKKNLGPSGSEAQFIIESPIPGIEVGFDGFIVNGKSLPVASYGYEIKDQAHVAKFVQYDKMPDPIRTINDSLSETFASYQYQGLYSNDIRISKQRKSYLTDPCCRFASPVGELMLEAFVNYSDLVWAVAHGKSLEPEIDSMFGAALNIFSEETLQGWVPVIIPDEYRRNVKLHYWSNFDGQDYVTPATTPISLLGVIVANEKTLEQSIDKVLEIAKEIKIPGITFNEGAFEHAEDQIEQGRRLGIPW